MSEYKTCNFDYTLPTAIFSRSTLTTYELDNINHAFSAISDKFGHKGKIEEIFELFGEFKDGAKDVIFSDDASKFESANNYEPIVEESEYKEMRCE